MPSIPPVSIIVPALNEEKYIPKLLESLAAAGETMDVIVVDGNSTDKTVAVARSFESRFAAPSSLRVISSERGISRQRNAGAAIAKNEILVFLDADIIIPSRKEYVTLISSFAKSDYSVAIPRISSLESTWRGGLIYIVYALWVRIFLLFGKAHFSGACLLTTKTIFNKIGGFNVMIPIGEDLDYARRANAIKPAGTLPVRIPVSDRRYIQQGYGKMFWAYLRGGVVFAVTGKVRSDKVPYQFGEYR